MKTRCPNCQTTFRVTSEQLKARAGKVRCGQCQHVFNALDSLLEETPPTPTPIPQPPPPPVITATVVAPEPEQVVEVMVVHEWLDVPTDNHQPPEHLDNPDASEPTIRSDDSPPEADAQQAEEEVVEEIEPLSETAAQALGKATGLILPRETTDIPGYSKWSEGVMTAPSSLLNEKPARWPFILAALSLVLVLTGQLIFKFRSEIAVTAPSLRPALEAFCQVFNTDLPLPRHVELVSIETSDLQADPAHGNLLALNATLRNRANYGQAFPSLELSLTDTQDTVIARRILPPSEYLSSKLSPDQPFAANSDVAVRLWIEAKDLTASGYRLYVFYP